MKTIILNERKEQAIDWSKPQILINKIGDIVVFSNGNHDDNKSTFEGSSLPCFHFPLLDFSTCWDKKSFQPIPAEGLTILIKND